jgi:hypothetical protein
VSHHEHSRPEYDSRPEHDSQPEPAGRPALPVRQIIASAARAGWANAGRIVLVAIAVSGATTAIEMVAHEFVDPADLPLAISADLAASGVSLLGVVFLSGFLSQLVGEAGHGREHARVRDILRHLSWRRLILADLLVVLLVVIGLIALVIPGLILINLFAIVGPVVEIENRPVIAALRRSAHLVRQHFWKVALLATLPVSVADEVTSAAPHSTGLTDLLTAFAIRGVAGALIEAVIGLVLAELAYRLMELDRDRPAPRYEGPVLTRVKTTKPMKDRDTNTKAAKAATGSVTASTAAAG